MSLEIFYPNGQVEAVQVYVWDTNTLQPILWDGAVSFSGSISVGSVDQGVGGVSAWLVTGPLTNAQLRAADVNVSLDGEAVAISNFPATQPVSIAGSVPVTGPLTDVQLRATPVPVSGTVVVDTSLLATAAKQDTGNTSLDNIKTNTDPLVVSGAGGYVRQDSTATIAKESGGNLASIAGKDFATSGKQDSQTTALNSIVTATQLIDDVVYVSGGVISKVAAIGAQFDAVGGLPIAEDRVGPLRMSALRELYTQIRSASGNEVGAIVNASGQLNVSVENALVITSITDPVEVTATDLDIRDLDADSDSIEVKGLVSDVPPSYLTNDIQSLSLTSDGRLRVSTLPAINDQIWQNTFNDPWGSIPNAGDIDHAFIGEVHV